MNRKTLGVMGVAVLAGLALTGCSSSEKRAEAPRTEKDVAGNLTPELKSINLRQAVVESLEPADLLPFLNRGRDGIRQADQHRTRGSVGTQEVEGGRHRHGRTVVPAHAVDRQTGGGHRCWHGRWPAARRPPTKWSS